MPKYEVEQIQEIRYTYFVDAVSEQHAIDIVSEMPTDLSNSQITEWLMPEVMDVIGL